MLGNFHEKNMEVQQMRDIFCIVIFLPILLSLGQKGSMARLLLITGYFVGIWCLVLTLGFVAAQGSGHRLL